jgi:uncharacterized protein (TIGR03435 family)
LTFARSVQQRPSKLRCLPQKTIVYIMTDRVARRFDLSRKLLLIVAGLVAVAVTFGLVPAAQSRAQSQVQDPVTKQDAEVKPPAFDFVTVKPGKHMLGTDIQTLYTRDSYSATNISLESLISDAYGLQMYNLVTGLPGWAKSATFDIEAKMDADTAAAYQKLPRKQQKEQHRWMMQSLLTDRFSLKVHHVTRQLPIYALVVAKGGSKLKESKAKESWMSGRDGQMDFTDASLETVAINLSFELDRIVLDETGLKGKYDLTLKWTPDEERGAADAGPSIFTAVQEQLGLRLKSTTGPVDTIVVDHIERPSPN